MVMADRWQKGQTLGCPKSRGNEWAGHGTRSDVGGCMQRGQRRREGGETRDRKGGEKRGVEVVDPSSPYRVFGGPTSLDAGSQGGTDGPKRGFLFGVGLCSTTFPILK